MIIHYMNIHHQVQKYIPFKFHFSYVPLNIYWHTHHQNLRKNMMMSYHHLLPTWYRLYNFGDFSFRLVEFLIFLFMMLGETRTSGSKMSQFYALITRNVIIFFLVFFLRRVSIYEIYQSFFGMLELVSFQVFIIVSNE